MILINFAHPLDAEQLGAVEGLAGGPVERVIEVPARFDSAEPFDSQAAELVEGAGLSAAERETAPMLVNLPSFAPISGLVLAGIHGRRGHFLAILRLQPTADSALRRFEVAEILNLQSVREHARTRRGPHSGRAAGGVVSPDRPLALRRPVPRFATRVIARMTGLICETGTGGTPNPRPPDHLPPHRSALPPPGPSSWLFPRLPPVPRGSFSVSSVPALGLCSRSPW